MNSSVLRILKHRPLIRFGSWGAASALAVLSSCSSGSSGGPPQSTGKPDAAAACSLNATGVVAGGADRHCEGGDSGRLVQVVSPASCHVDAGPPAENVFPNPSVDGGDDGTCGDPAYGPALYGSFGSDDDCKYDVQWQALSAVCAGAPVNIQVTASVRATGAPLTGASPFVLASFDCSVPAASPTAPISENPPGTYVVGPITFANSGRWSLRFHFNEQCDDLTPSSPHGHAAFWVDVP